MSTPTWNNPVVKWIDYRLPVFTFTHHSLVDYPTPRNLNYFWNMGSLAGVVLVIMIATGIFLAMNYVANTALAFDSVERIMRDVNFGWLIRYMHANGASFFFIVVYIHIFRGLYYGSYKEPRELLWIIGVCIIFAMMGTAFLGYVLPWGQLSFWAATVITNLFSALPIIGTPIVEWLWGGFSVDNPTLNRFFALHYLMPFVILGLVVLHLWALHVHKSNNPSGVDIQGPQDTIPFHPYYTIKDMYGLGVLLTVYFFFVFFYPNFFAEPLNYDRANPLVTPALIVPEWYFLPFFAILRAIPDKLGGVIALGASVGVLFFVPWLDTSKVRSARYRPIYKQIFWLLVIDVVVLGWAGGQKAEGAALLISRIGTAYYFAHFLFLMPLLGIIEKTKALPDSIAADVLKDQPMPEVPPASGGGAS